MQSARLVEGRVSQTNPRDAAKFLGRALGGGVGTVGCSPMETFGPHPLPCRRDREDSRVTGVAMLGGLKSPLTEQAVDRVIRNVRRPATPVVIEFAVLFSCHMMSGFI